MFPNNKQIAFVTTQNSRNTIPHDVGNFVLGNIGFVVAIMVDVLFPNEDAVAPAPDSSPDVAVTAAVCYLN